MAEVSQLEGKLAEQQHRISRIEESLNDILGVLKDIRSTQQPNPTIEVEYASTGDEGVASMDGDDLPGNHSPIEGDAKRKHFRKLAPSRARLASTILTHLQSHARLEEQPHADAHSKYDRRKASHSTERDKPSRAKSNATQREAIEYDGGSFGDGTIKKVWGNSRRANGHSGDLATPMLATHGSSSTRGSAADEAMYEVLPDGTQRRIDSHLEEGLYDQAGTAANEFPPLATILTRDFWRQLWAWFSTCGTLETKHVSVGILDLVYVIGTTVVSVLSLSLFTAKLFNRVEISDEDWRVEAAWALVFQVFFCIWLFSRPFIRVRRGRWVVLDTVPEICRYYVKSRLLWFDIFVTIPWGLPYYMGLFDAKAFSVLSLINLLRWFRCFRLNGSTHPLSPSKLGFKLFVTFCAIITFVHMLAVLYPILDQLSSNDISYLEGLYYIVITMAAVGYGDIVPKQPLGRGFAIFIVVTGLGSISLFTAALTKYLNEKDDWDVEIAGKRKMLRKMLNHYEIPWKVQKELMIRVPEVHQAQKNELFLETMSMFPPAVQGKVKLYVIAKSLFFAVPIVQEESMRALLLEAQEEDEAATAQANSRSSLRSESTNGYMDFDKANTSRPSTLPSTFKGRADLDTFIHKIEPTNFWRQLKFRMASRHADTYVSPTFKTKEFPVALELAARMKPHFIGPSETVFQSGDVGREMFFIFSGTVELSAVVGNTEDQKISKCLKPMQFFGEAALLEETVRCARAKCVTACELYSLHQRDVADLKARYPWLAERIQDEIAIAVRAAKRTAVFAAANAAIMGEGDQDAEASSTAIGPTCTASDIAMHLRKHAPGWAGPRARDDDTDSVTSYSMQSLNCFVESRRSIGTEARANRSRQDDLQRCAKELLERVHGVDIVVDIPLSAFDSL